MSSLESLHISVYCIGNSSGAILQVTAPKSVR